MKIYIKICYTYIPFCGLGGGEAIEAGRPGFGVFTIVGRKKGSFLIANAEEKLFSRRSSFFIKLLCNNSINNLSILRNIGKTLIN